LSHTRHLLATLFPYTTLFRSKALIVASVPELTIRTISTEGTRSITSSANRFSSVVEAPKLVPFQRLILISAQLVPVHVLVIVARSEEHTSELQSRFDLVCRLL